MLLRPTAHPQRLDALARTRRHAPGSRRETLRPRTPERFRKTPSLFIVSDPSPVMNVPRIVGELLMVEVSREVVFALDPHESVATRITATSIGPARLVIQRDTAPEQREVPRRLGEPRPTHPSADANNAPSGLTSILAADSADPFVASPSASRSAASLFSTAGVSRLFGRASPTTLSRPARVRRK